MSGDDGLKCDWLEAWAGLRSKQCLQGCVSDLGNKREQENVLHLHIV